MGLIPTNPGARLFLFVFFGFLIASFTYYLGTIKTQINAPDEIKLTDVKVSYVPETEEIVFINKKDNTMRNILSKEVVIAVFSLKATNIQQDYLASSGQGTKSGASVKADASKKK